LLSSENVVDTLDIEATDEKERVRGNCWKRLDAIDEALV